MAIDIDEMLKQFQEMCQSATASGLSKDCPQTIFEVEVQKLLQPVEKVLGNSLQIYNGKLDI